jgi:RNA polymerase sigma-70 factor, ECF subfamily
MRPCSASTDEASTHRDDARGGQASASRDGGRSDELMRAIEVLYRDSYATYYRVACSITRDAELARDAVQDAFARAIRRRDDFRGDGPLEGWLWRTVLNVAKDHCRARTPGQPLELLDELPDPAHREPAEQSHEDVRHRISALPERQRLALFLRYYVDMSYAEIGQTLDIRTGTVSATLNAAHRALRSDLEALRGDGIHEPRRLPAASPRRRARPELPLSACVGARGSRRQGSRH